MGRARTGEPGSIRRRRREAAQSPTVRGRAAFDRMRFVPVNRSRPSLRACSAGHAVESVDIRLCGSVTLWPLPRGRCGQRDRRGSPWLTSSSSAAGRPGPPSPRCSPSRAASVELFERERFPRFHIGESLIPETYWVLKRLEHAAEDAGEPLRQEVQRAVRQRERQAVGAVLLLGQQAARVLADLAGGAQRVRPDDARQRPRARRHRARRRARARRPLRGRRAPSASRSATRTARGARSAPRSSSTPAARPA